MRTYIGRKFSGSRMIFFMAIRIEVRSLLIRRWARSYIEFIVPRRFTHDSKMVPQVNGGYRSHLRKSEKHATMKPRGVKTICACQCFEKWRLYFALVNYFKSWRSSLLPIFWPLNLASERFIPLCRPFKFLSAFAFRLEHRTKENGQERQNHVPLYVPRSRYRVPLKLCVQRSNISKKEPDRYKLV